MACQASEASQFDFWLGHWDAVWPAEQTGGEKDTWGSGTNHIVRILDGCVIEESFAADGGLQGKSFSVFDPASGLWRQTWVDSDGNYLLLTGEFGGEQMILSTEPKDRDGESVVHRMVFRDITAESFLWQWQRRSSRDRSWSDLWTIDYRRRAIAGSAAS